MKTFLYLSSIDGDEKFGLFEAPFAKEKTQNKLGFRVVSQSAKKFNLIFYLHLFLNLDFKHEIIWKQN